MLRLLRQVSVRQLRMSWGRTSLVVGGIATGVTLIVAINIINTSVLNNFRHTIELIAGPAALEVTLGLGEVGFDEAVVNLVRANPDVVAAVPLVRGTIALAEKPTATLQLFGVDFLAEDDLQRYQVKAVTDRRELLRGMEDPRSILLTTRFSKEHDIAVGNVVSFSTPNGVEALTVRGLLLVEGVAAALGGQLAVMDLPAAQLLLGKDGRIDQIDVMLQDDADVESNRRRLTTALPSVLTVARPTQRSAQYDRILSSFQAMLTGLSALCLVAGLFIIYNTTSTGAIQRTYVISELRMIGADKRIIFQVLMIEALVLGSIGTLLGVAVGIPLARLLAGTVTDSMGVIFQLRFPLQDLVIDGSQLSLIAGVGVAVALFASSFAARQLTSLDPVDVMRTQLCLTTARIRSGRLVVWWVALITTSLAAFVAESQFKSIAWGNFGSTLWNASVIVIAVPVVRCVSGPLAHWLPRIFGAEGHVAAASLLRGPVRTGVTVAAIALVLTIGISLSALVVSCRKSLQNYFSGQLAADFVVSGIATEGGWLEIPLPAKVAEALRGVPGVRAVEEGRIVSGQMFRGERIGLLALSSGAFDPARYPEGWYREGDAVRAAPLLKAGRGVAISTSLGDRFNLHAGDRIELDTPTGVLDLPIVGVVPDYVSDRGSVIFSRQVLVERWGETSISRANVFLAPGASPDAVRAQIVEEFGERYRLKVLTMREVLAYHTDMINRAFAVMNSVQLLIIIVTVAGIFDLLHARIIERRRELAVWRLIGAEERTVRRSVIVESATIGIIGAVMGVAVGMITAWLWIGVHFRELLGYYVEYHFAFGATLWYVTLVIAMTTFAGYSAAYQATRQSVLQGIQTE